MKSILTKGETAMAWKGKIPYTIQYNKEKTTTVNVRLNTGTDADLIAYLQTIGNKQGLIKDLLREEMKKDNFIYTPEEKNEPTTD